jgi:hypothetical protein
MRPLLLRTTAAQTIHWGDHLLSRLTLPEALRVRSRHAGVHRPVRDQPPPYMGHRESRPGFRARARSFLFSSFLTVSLFGLRSPFLRPGPPCQWPARAGSVKDAHLRAREGFVLDGPEHTGRLGTRRATMCNDLGIGLFIRQRTKTAEPYIRRARSRAQTHIPHAGEGRGRAGRDQSFGRH